MGDVSEHTNGGSSSGRIIPTSGMVPKPENTIASSSMSKVRSNLLGMGFQPTLVDKVIREKGEEDMNLLLETLFEYSAQPNSISSDSLDSLFEDDDGSCAPEVSSTRHPEELDSVVQINDERRKSLLTMNFSINEIEFAIDKLGRDAPINELVDLIIASRIAIKFGKEGDDVANGNEDKMKEVTNGALNVTMEKALKLLQMGFSEDQVSAAIERFGSEVPLPELADSIFADQIAGDCTEKDKLYPSTASEKNDLTEVYGISFGEGMDIGERCQSNTLAAVKMEDHKPGSVYQSSDINRVTDHRGKRPKQEYSDDFYVAGPQVGHYTSEAMGAGKRPKQEYFDDTRPFSGFTYAEETINSAVNSFRLPRQPNSSRPLDQIVAKRPYFFYGNVADLSEDSWSKISQFLYAAKPEFVNTGCFSALSRKEGYIHNLPTENRFYICPKPPMSIEDAIPTTKKWWPSWDTRKQLITINSEVTGMSELCKRLGRMLYDCQGLISPGQQRDILHHCQTRNLVWVGRYQLSTIDPDHLEFILGYPLKHTEDASSSLVERLQFLKYCFQTDTLGYHLSVLKSLFPNGVTVLSVFSGIGGTEIALHRLGIHMRGVVSIEISETKRKILRRWWSNTRQVGELVEIEDVQKLTTTRLESLMEKFGGFDLVICQNPSSQSPTSRIGPGSDGVVGFDFPLFYEFVRILQRVRSYMERRR